MKISLKPLFLLFLIFSFLPSFCFQVGKMIVPVYIIFTIFLFFLICMLKPKLLLKKILVYWKKTPFKYLILFSIWAFITIIFSILKGKFYIGGFINSTFGGLIVSVLLTSVIVLFLVPRYIKIKSLLFYVYVFSIFIFLVGILDFIVNYLDISPLKNIISVFANRRQFGLNADITQRVFYFGIPRIRSVFEEPANLGYYCAIISPIIYEIVFNKIPIFKNIYFEKIIRKIIIPLMWLNIILTLSPIYLIFNILISAYYFVFVRKIQLIIIKNKIYSILFLIISFLSVFILFNINYEETYLNRIIVFFQNITTFENFIVAEPSLATRIIIYINAIELGLKNIITGVGYGNMSYLIGTKLMSSNLPLTQELINFVAESKTSPASSIFIKVFSETAIWGTFLFYQFLFLLLKHSKIKKDTDKIPQRGLSLFCLMFIITSFYGSNINQPYIWIILSLLLCICFYRRKYVFR